VKLHADTLDGVNVISGYTPRSITVNGVAWAASLILPARGDALAWPVAHVDGLSAEHFDAVIALEPELLLLGTGAALKFAPPPALRHLMQRRIGVETMDTAAACRTYNILVGEGRKVVAAIIVAAAAA
jgi:uncharacterized protein